MIGLTKHGPLISQIYFNDFIIPTLDTSTQTCWQDRCAFLHLLCLHTIWVRFDLSFNKSLVAVLITSTTVRVVGLLGIFHSVQPFGVENCQRIKGPTLCEDATYGTQGGEFYLTCDSTRNYLNRPMGIKLAVPVGQEGEPQIWRMQLSKVWRDTCSLLVCCR